MAHEINILGIPGEIKHSIASSRGKVNKDLFVVTNPWKGTCYLLVETASEKFEFKYTERSEAVAKYNSIKGLRYAFETWDGGWDSSALYVTGDAGQSVDEFIDAHYSTEGCIATLHTGYVDSRGQAENIFNETTTRKRK